MKVLTLLILLMTCITGCAVLPCQGPDLNEFVSEPASFSCGAWWSETPALDRVLVDVFFGKRADSTATSGPLPSDVRAVEAVGGEIVHKFNCRMVRAVVGTDRIPYIAGLAKAMVVSDAARVGFSFDVSCCAEDRDALIDLLEEYRTRPESQSTHVTPGGEIWIALVWTPDSSVPGLERTGRFGAVEPSEPGCFDADDLRSRLH